MRGFTAEELAEMAAADAEIEAEFCLTNAERRLSAELDRAAAADERADYKRAYYRANKTHIAAQRREYYRANKPRILAKSRTYQQAHKESVARQKHEWYVANKERILKKHREYQQANQEHIAERQREYRRKRKEQRQNGEYGNTHHPGEAETALA